MINSTISIVIGSWGSYNACNERALGSKWLDLSDYADWDEIEAELIKQGFKLDGIDEELFIQDIEGVPSNGANWDYTNPKQLFALLCESDVLTDSYKFEVMQAYLEVCNFSDFEDLVKDSGSHWDDDIHLYRNFDWEDYGREMFECYGYKIDDRLLDFFDFEAYGQYIGEYAQEYDGGIIEIFR